MNIDPSSVNLISALFVAFAGLAVHVLRGAHENRAIAHMAQALCIGAVAIACSGFEAHPTLGALTVLFWPLMSASIVLAGGAIGQAYDDADRLGTTLAAFGGSALCLLLVSGWARELVLNAGIAICLIRWLALIIRQDNLSAEFKQIRSAGLATALALLVWTLKDSLHLLTLLDSSNRQTVTPVYIQSRLDIALGFCAVALYLMWMRQTVQRRDLKRRLQLDPLTGLASREYLLQSSERWIKDHPIGVALMVIDIDHFRSINEKYGHIVGDSVLKHVGKTLKTCLRKDSLIARYGGEEFGLIIPVTDKPEASKVAERLRFEVEQQPFFIGSEAVNLTISIGVTIYDEKVSLTQALVEADTRLHEAKMGGRNRVMVAAL